MTKLPPHRCAIPGCTDPLRSRELMCRWHWKKLPRPLKLAVLETWRAVQPQDAPRGYAERILAYGKYHEARKAAVDHICEQEGIHAIAS